MEWVEWVAQKWGGRPHRRGEMQALGDDEHGRWFWGPKGGMVSFADGGERVRERTVLFLLPDDWWCAQWWTDHPDVTVYVDISTPPEWWEDRVVTVDLDLDVLQFADGRVEIHDRDEFELHGKRYGYPPDVIEAAERAAAEVARLVSTGHPPFDEGTARAWFARIESESRDQRGSVDGR